MLKDRWFNARGKIPVWAITVVLCVLVVILSGCLEGETQAIKFQHNFYEGTTDDVYEVEADYEFLYIFGLSESDAEKYEDAADEALMVVEIEGNDPDFQTVHTGQWEDSVTWHIYITTDYDSNENWDRFLSYDELNALGIADDDYVKSFITKPNTFYHINIIKPYGTNIDDITEDDIEIERR